MPVPPVFNEAEVGSDPDVAPNKTLDLVARLLDSDASTATSASVSSGSAPADKFSTDGTTTVEKAAYGESCSAAYSTVARHADRPQGSLAQSPSSFLASRSSSSSGVVTRSAKRQKGSRTRVHLALYSYVLYRYAAPSATLVSYSSDDAVLHRPRVCSSVCRILKSPAPPIRTALYVAGRYCTLHEAELLAASFNVVYWMELTLCSALL